MLILTFYYNRIYYSFYLLISLWVFSCTNVLANPVLSPAEQDIISQRQKNVLEEAKLQREELQNLMQLGTPIAGDSIPVSDGPCILITQIKFSAAANLPRVVTQKILPNFENHCLTLAQMEFLVHEVTNEYIKAGMITSMAYLDAQDVSGGLLIISVQEGRIGTITLDGQKARIIDMVLPHLEGQILNLRDIEQGLEQLNRLRSQKINIDITPGTQNGYSDILLTYETKQFPIEVTVGSDNSGQKSTGTGQFQGQITVDNPLGLADQWQFTANRDNHFYTSRRSDSLSGTATIAYGYWNFGYSYARNSAYYDMPLQYASWRYASKTYQHHLTIGRMLYRDGQSKLSLNIGLTHRKIHNTIANQTLTISSPTITRANLGLNYSSTLLGGYITFNPSIYQGLDILRATPDNLLQQSTPRSEFRKATISASYFRPLTDRVYYLGSLYGQWTTHNLYSAERIAIGGEYSVRGYKEQTLSGHRGGYLRNELTWTLTDIPKIGRLSFTGAFDHGWIKAQENQSDDGYLIGGSFGFSVSGSNINSSLTVGKPLHYPLSMKPDRWVSYYQFSYTF